MPTIGSAAVQWSALDARRALLCLPALGIILAAGILLGRPDAAMAALSGALSVGFGAFQSFTHHRSAPMVLAALGMALSAAVGSVAGNVEAALLAATVLWSAACGWLASLGPGAWWIALQWCIALFVGGAYPADLHESLIRAGLVLIGGALQYVIIAGAWRVRSPPQPVHISRLPAYLRLARRKLREADATLSYALQAGGGAALALLTAHVLHFSHSYWAPMTVLLVIKSNVRETLGRGLQRALGTFIGAAIATLAEFVLQPGPALTGVLVVIFAWCSYATLRVHYVVFTASITACIVFLVVLSGLPEPVNAFHRIAATLLGASIALLISAVSDAVGRRGRAHEA
jgi:hypothetical protein